MKIDLVIPFVDMSDHIWLEKYSNATGKPIESFKYRSNDLFKFFFRGIAKNMPWLNNIYLVVDCESQVPEWLDTTKVKVIYHTDFIPSQYLPTFNACTIELFEYLIPGLEEHYIVANDDFFAVGEVQPSDFFDLETGKPLITFVPVHMLGTNTGEVRPWTAFTVRQYKEFIDQNASTCIKRPGHNFTAHTKTIWLNLFANYSEQLYNSITQLTDAKNYNQYCACYYGLANNLVIDNPSGLQEGLFSYSTRWAGIIKYDLLNNQNRKIVCINDTNKTDGELHHTAREWINEALAYRVGNEPCTYELLTEDSLD